LVQAAPLVVLDIDLTHPPGNPVDVAGIADYTFVGCRSLTSITIGNGVTSIGVSSFYGCRSLTSITIPDGVTSIGANAFHSCTSLTSITFGENSQLTSIRNYAFNSCTSLTSITIPDGVTSIGGWAFFNCTSLTSITIPDSVTSIGEAAFQICSSLTSITFQGAAPTVGVEAFTGVPDGAVALVTIETLSSFGELGTDWNSLTVSMSASYLNDLATQVAELSQRPTQASYDAVVAERDARPTLQEVRDGRPGSVLLSVDSEAGSVVLDFTVEESEDLITWTPVEGPGVSQTLTLPEGKRFYRFAH
jgi:hypothetical protein